MVQIVPLEAKPNQVVTVQLGGQTAQLHVYQKSTGLFMDVYVNAVLVVGGVICQNLNRIIRSRYFGFEGDLCFIDNQGKTDPYYTGLGDRYSLAYLEASELAPGVG